MKFNLNTAQIQIVK